MPDQTLDYFLKKGIIKVHDAADIQWYHAANSKDKITEALQGQSVNYTHQNYFLFIQMFPLRAVILLLLNRHLLWSSISLTIIVASPFQGKVANAYSKRRPEVDT